MDAHLKDSQGWTHLLEDFLLGIFLVFIEHLGLQSSAWVVLGGET